MSILQKLKEISLYRNKKQQEKQSKDDTQEEEVIEIERVFDIPKKSRPPSIFIQLGSYDVIPIPQKEEEKRASEIKKAAEAKIALEEAKKDDDYEALILKAWEESVDDSELEAVPHFYEHEADSEDSFSDSEKDRRLAIRRVAVRQSRILSVLSYQAREISRAKEERRPISLILNPTKSAMKRSSVETEAKKRRSLTIVDPRDPMNPHSVICRKRFLEELRAQDRLSFNSSDFKQQPTPETETKDSNNDHPSDDPKDKGNEGNEKQEGN